MLTLRLSLVAALFLAVSSLSAAEPAPTHPLVWEATSQTVNAKPGDSVAEYVYRVTNTAPAPVEVVQLTTSCGCTIAEMPSKPWVLPPGGKGSFRVTLDFHGKHGTLIKAIYVDSTAGKQTLNAVVTIPDMPDDARLRNQQAAHADRQAVFRGDCAACHAAPAAGKTGAELFVAACVVCHMSERRASMVPDLAVAKVPRDAQFWRQWIAEGKEGTLMPAFSQARGGPLTAAQIDSLVEYALKTLPTQPAKP